jgi:hypothetical protein
MKLEKTIVVYATDNAKKAWEGRERPKRSKKFYCPSCEIGEPEKSAPATDEEAEHKTI